MDQAINDCLAGWNSMGKAFCGYAAGAFVQAAVLILVLFALDVLLRRRVRAVFRYYVWLLVLVKLVLPPTLSLPTGIGYWIGDRVLTVPVASEPVSIPGEHERAEVQRYAGPEPSGGSPQAQSPVNASETVVPVPAVPWNGTAITWQGVVLLLWLAGLLAFLVLLAQRWRFVRGLVAASTPAGDDLLGLLERCRRQIGVRRPVGLRILDTFPSPAVCGLWRPMILMPATLVQKLSPEGLRAALIHELAHIKRADLWINLVQTFLQVIYFYHPFVWLANAMIRRTCEEAVDETVLVTLGGQAKTYSITLIDISEMAFWKADFGLRLIGVAESKRALQGRIRHMLTRPIPKTARIGALGAIVILVVAAVLLPMASGKEQGQRGTPGLMDRLQKEDDPELAEMIRAAVANHKGANEKEILEITRRVTRSRAQVLLWDQRIEEMNRKIEANPGSGETREGLLRSKKELETKRTGEMANLREALGIVPGLPLAAPSTTNPQAFKLSPADGAEEVGVNGLELTWPAGAKAQAYNVYLGLNPENPGLLGKVELAGATVSHLKSNTKYYWRVDAVGADGSVVGGKVNAFTTGGLAAWWKLDEESGRVAHDSSGRGNAGTLEGNPQWQPAGGRVGGALDFDGQGSFVSIGDPRPFNVRTAVSVAAWVKVRAFDRQFQTVAAKGESSWRLARDRERDALAFGAGPYQNNCVARGEVNVNDREWHHVVGVSDAESVSLYVDGVLDQAVAVPGQMKSDNSPVYIGTNPDPNFLTRYWNGWIDELSVFTYPLGADEVKALYFGLTPLALTSPPVSPGAPEAKIVLAPLDTRARLVRAERAKGPLQTGNLNAWVKLQVLAERVVVLETLKRFSDNWFLTRHKVVGAYSERETLDYLQGRLKDAGSLPIRLHIFFSPESKNAAEDLRGKIRALAREAKVDTETEVRMEPSTWVGSGESPFYLREGKIRTFYPAPYPGSVPRPDGGSPWLTNGLVHPNDLEQHILWRLTMPKNVPLTFRVEYDEASYDLAKQVADTAKAVVKRVGLTDLVGVAGTLVEPVPESAFLGRWQALGNGVIQSVDIQPGGVCQVLVGEGLREIKAGTSMRVPWVWTVREIQFNIGDPVLGLKGYPPYIYRASLKGDGDLIIRRGEIYPQGSFMHTRPPQMVFRKVSQPGDLARVELESKPTMPEANLPQVGTAPKSSPGQRATANLNAWVSLQLLPQRVVVLDAQKPFSDNWAMARYRVVGLLSERETLDYLQGRLQDKKSLPIRIQIYYKSETHEAAQDLHQKIVTLAREAKADADTDIRLELISWVGDGTSPFYLREGRIWTFLPKPVRRPDGGSRLLSSGLVDPNDLEQYILWRLTKPKNLPVTFRIEYDEASSVMAKNVADTVRQVVKRVGLADVVSVTGDLVTPLPESVFLGQWQGMSNSLIQSIDVQPGGLCQVLVGEGSRAIAAGTTVAGSWVRTLKEIYVNINDPVQGRRGYPPYIYRATVDGEGHLVVDRGEIYPQGSYMNIGPSQMILNRVP